MIHSATFLKPKAHPELCRIIVSIISPLYYSEICYTLLKFPILQRNDKAIHSSSQTCLVIMKIQTCCDVASPSLRIFTFQRLAYNLADAGGIGTCKKLL